MTASMAGIVGTVETAGPTAAAIEMAIAPRVLRRRLVALSTLVATALVSACGAVADLGELATLSGALSDRYGAPAHVNVHNGTHLTITFQNAPAAELGPAEREAFAREVAEFTRTTYSRAHELAEIRVGFSETSGVGPVRVTRTEAPYHWSIAELSPPAVPGDSGGVQ